VQARLATAVAATVSTIASAQTAAIPPREIVRLAVETDRKSQAAARNYTFLMRQEQRQFDTAGRTQSRESRTWDYTLVEGSPFRRLVSRDDRPLAEKEQKLEEEKLRKSIEERRRETPGERERRIADWERSQEKRREPLREIPDAFDFKLAGEEAINGVQVYVIDATPHPGYRPKSASAAFLPKVRARFWIAKNDYHWVKLDMETLDTVALGAILVRLAKGSHLMVEQTKVNNEVWLLKAVDLRITARILLVKGLRREYLFTFSDYKKFQVTSRVVE
jgi:hypothetical protein